MRQQIDRAAEAALANPRAKVELSAEVRRFEKGSWKRRRRIEEAEAAEACLAAEPEPKPHVRTRKMIVSSRARTGQ